MCSRKVWPLHSLIKTWMSYLQKY
uniref:Uncharacterized protein n=1 Tax=Rhizophora mucronata TaxID=61149 RepID=A0A2P2R347_RHIMU